MTTAVIEAASVAAFTTYHRPRAYYTWETAHESVKSRWNIVITRVVGKTITSGYALREAYMDGIYAKSWAEIGPSGRKLWQSIYDAAVRAWHDAEAKERPGLAA